MRWLLAAALLWVTLAAGATTPEALRDLLVKMDQAARRQQPLAAEDVPALLGLRFDTGCLENAPPSSDSCWRQLTAPALDWPGVYGRSDAIGMVVTLNRLRERPPCMRAADVAKALPMPPHMVSQMAGFGHMTLGGLEAAVPHYEKRPT